MNKNEYLMQTNKTNLNTKEKVMNKVSINGIETGIGYSIKSITNLIDYKNCESFEIRKISTRDMMISSNDSCKNLYVIATDQNEDGYSENDAKIVKMVLKRKKNQGFGSVRIINNLNLDSSYESFKNILGSANEQIDRGNTVQYTWYENGIVFSMTYLMGKVSELSLTNVLQMGGLKNERLL